MIWRFARKELLTNLRTYRLAVALVFTAVLSVMTTVTGGIDFYTNQAAYTAQVRRASEELQKATVYAQVAPQLVFPPQPLSILSRGAMETFARQCTATPFGINIYVSPLQTSYDSQFMKSLVQIDFTTVVALLLSFLAVVLAYDGICGEREQGTLKLVLANPVARGQVIAGKLVGGILTLTVPFAVGFGLSLLLILAMPNAALSGEDWMRLGIYFAVSVLFLGLVYSLSLMVSTWARSPDTALILCLFAWLVSGIGYLNALPSLSRYAIEVPPNQTYMGRRQELADAHQAVMRQWDQAHPPPQAPVALGLPRGGAQNGGLLRRYGTPAGYDWLASRTAFEMPRRLDLERQLYRVRWEAWKPLAAQGYAVDAWSILSPIASYQVLSRQVARTSLSDLFYLSDRARQYRETLVSYLEGKGAFGSRRWFSDDPAGQEPMFAAAPDLPAGTSLQGSPLWQERMAWVEEQDRLAAASGSRGLDLSDLPPFGGRWQRSVPETLQQMLGGLVVLLLAFGASVLATVARFLRYDPT
ncbi:MAG: ABC transporter permease subunit [Gemmatimonadota bacterium]